MSSSSRFETFCSNVWDLWLPIFAALAIVSVALYGFYELLSVDLEVSESRYEEMMTYTDIKGVQPLILEALEDGKVQRTEFFNIKRQALKFSAIESMEAQ